MGVPKHRVRLLGGETLLERLVRQSLEAGAETLIVARDPDDPNYQVDGATTVPAVFHPEMRDADKFYSSHHLWSPHERTILLYGDVWLTTPAATQIFDNNRPFPHGYWVYARFTGSTITGTPWGENLAHAIDPHGHDRYRTSLEQLPHLTTNHKGGRCGGWEQYMHLTTGNPTTPITQGPNSTHINDWSDDFDYPADYERWLDNWTEAPPHVQTQAH